MAKEGFNWKSIFIIEDEKQTTAANPVNETNKFPTENVQTTGSTNLNNPFIPEVVEVYEKGFESLNTPDFDFFEFYKSVTTVGINNSQSYQMAFSMGSAMNSGLSKATLIEKANYYISEIEKVYKNFEKTGNTRKGELNARINEEKQTLNSSVADLEAQIVQMQKELIDRKADLEKLNSTNREEFSEIELKLAANEIAKKGILQSINQVVTGINQYLK